MAVRRRLGIADSSSVVRPESNLFHAAKAIFIRSRTSFHFLETRFSQSLDYPEKRKRLHSSRAVTETGIMQPIMTRRSLLSAVGLSTVPVLAHAALGQPAFETADAGRHPIRPTESDMNVTYATKTVGDVEVFYREAGAADAPVLLLLHGFPTSGHMFRDLIPLLADRYHVIAPDLPGFGNTIAPGRAISLPKSSEVSSTRCDLRAMPFISSTMGRRRGFGSR